MNIINSAVAVPGALATAVYEGRELVLTLDYSIPPRAVGAGAGYAHRQQFIEFWDAVFHDGAFSGIYSINGEPACYYTSADLLEHSMNAWECLGYLNLRFYAVQTARYEEECEALVRSQCTWLSQASAEPDFKSSVKDSIDGGIQIV